jgi:hypothetical protein
MFPTLSILPSKMKHLCIMIDEACVGKCDKAAKSDVTLQLRLTAYKDHNVFSRLGT